LETFNIYGCQAKWLVYLDADVVITDLSRSLESIISHSADNGEGNTFNISTRGDSVGARAYSDSCDFIAQLSPTTINTGLLFFRFSQSGERILVRWIRNYLYNTDKNLTWVDDQVSAS